MSEIKWDEMLAGSFIKLEDAKPTTLTCKNWRPQTQFKDDKTGEIRPGLTLDVWKEDNAIFQETTIKEWTMTAKGAMIQLRPIIEKAEAAGKDQIVITVVRVGEGKGTKYSIKEVVE